MIDHINHAKAAAERGDFDEARQHLGRALRDPSPSSTPTDPSSMSDHWIQGAIKHPGALHKELGVPKGEKIPDKKLTKAAHSDDPKLARRARLAETLKGLNKSRNAK